MPRPRAFRELRRSAVGPLPGHLALSTASCGLVARVCSAAESAGPGLFDGSRLVPRASFRSLRRACRAARGELVELPAVSPSNRAKADSRGRRRPASQRLRCMAIGLPSHYRQSTPPDLLDQFVQFLRIGPGVADGTEQDRKPPEDRLIAHQVLRDLPSGD
jgi:hypothetical protein